MEDHSTIVTRPTRTHILHTIPHGSFYRGARICGAVIHLGRSGQVHAGPSAGHYPTPRLRHRRSLPLTRLRHRKFSQSLEVISFYRYVLVEKGPLLLTFKNWVEGDKKPKEPFSSKKNLVKMTPPLYHSQNLLDPHEYP